MNSAEDVLDQFETLMADWSHRMSDLPAATDRRHYFEKALPALLLNKPVIQAVLKDLIRGKRKYKLKTASVFENEILVYMDSQRRFSVRFYLFRPGEFTFIHDHGSWGVSGTCEEKLSVIRYQRKDDGNREDYADLEITDRIEFTPGTVETTLPIDRGIHQTGNRTAGPLLMISVYGSPDRRLFIQRFNITDRTVHKIFPLKLVRQSLARQVYDTLS